MKKKIMTFTKYFRFLYNIYYYIGSFVLNILKFFVRTDKKIFLINSFGGKKFDDSPKAIFDAMIKDNRFDNYKFVWAFHEPDKFVVERADKIKTDTLKYYITALKARCWITNSGIERGLNFKGKDSFYFNTWHGTPIKKMGTDILKSNTAFAKKTKKSNIDTFAVQGDFEADIFSRVFNIDKDNILRCGLPRNDKLVKYTEETKNKLKTKLNLPLEKKIILYAPTFREYERDVYKNCVLKPPMNLKFWEDELSDEYFLLFRAHYEVGKIMEIQDNDFVKNVSDYPILDDLMIASDILISDYSSIFFDYAVMGKPMLHFAYDYEKYEKNRGMYFDIRDEVNGAENEEELIKILRNINKVEEIEKTKKFQKKYVNYFGSATQTAVDYIYSKISDR